MYETDGDYLFYEEIRGKKLGRSGFFGKIKAKASRKNMIQHYTGAIEEVAITREDGTKVTIPSDFFTKTGKLKKSKETEYRRLLGKELR